MNPVIHIALLIFVLALVAICALGFCWFVTRNRRSPCGSPTTPQSGSHANVRPASPFDEPEEWESHAPYPDYVQQAAHSTQSPHRIHPPSPNLEPTAQATHNDVDNEPFDVAEPLSVEPDASAPIPVTPSPAPSSSPANRCPRCLSSRIDTRNRARKAGSAIGSVAGATGGMAAALAGAETGAVVGSIAGPLGTVFGGLAGAVIAGLVGSAAGCAAGSAVGSAVDDNLLDNYQCLACTHSFSVKQAA